jgi:hypothetical protein
MILKLSLAAIIMIGVGGCATDNPFGVGYEHSACEMASGFGVCGSPKRIYKYRDIIKETQSKYLASGYDEDLFFSISDDGNMLVKTDRTSRWERYAGSEIQQEIEVLLKEKKSYQQGINSHFDKKISHPINYNGQDLPVTDNSDLSVQYLLQKPVLETRTDVGEVIRTNGIVQKIWIAPVADRKGDLISAHEIYLVVKEPEWNIGEVYPNNSRNVGIIPTPISQSILSPKATYTPNDYNIVKSYKTNNDRQLNKALRSDPEYINEINKMKQIKDYLGE